MAVITFISDFGLKDHYVAAVKAAILRVNPNIQIVDISHEIALSDIGNAAFLLQQVFRDFPLNSVHLCGVDTNSKNKYIAIKLEEHYFIGPDSGLFSLVSDQKPSAIIELNTLNPINSSFATKEILAPMAARLASGKNIHELGPALSEIKTLIGRQLKVTKKEISGTIIQIDHFGNLITNITKQEFDTITNLNGSDWFEIQFGRERISALTSRYADVDPGDCFVFFNSNGVLQIGINQGNASELLGLLPDAPVSIRFSNEN